MDEKMVELQKMHFVRMGMDKDFSGKIYKKEKEFYNFVDEDFRKKLKSMVILNIGCGPYPIRFNAKKEIALDPNIRFYKNNFNDKYLNGMEIIEGDVSDMNIKNDSVDFVLCRRVIEYIRDWERAITEMHRVLKRRGYLVMIYNSYQMDQTNLNLLLSVDMKSYLQDNGFIIMKYVKESSSNYIMIMGRKK